MIQDIAPKTFYNEYTPETPSREDPVFVFRDREVLLAGRENGALCCPKAGDFPREDLQYLFRIDERKYYLFRGDIPENYGQADQDQDQANELETGQDQDQANESGTGQDQDQANESGTSQGGGPADQQAADQEPTAEDGIFSRLEAAGFEICPTRIFRRADPKDLCFAGMTAWHLYAWYRESAFCGRCGHRTVHAESERVMRCPACGHSIYPKIAPAVIVGVTDGDRIMMTRYAGRSYKGHALIAGFCEIGENMEETVRREVIEEVGLKVKNISYYKSQPCGFAFNLLMGFYCEVDGDTTVTMDEKELAVAKWVHAGDIGQEERNLSLTAEMIMHFKESRLAGRGTEDEADGSNPVQNPGPAKAADMAADMPQDMPVNMAAGRTADITAGMPRTLTTDPVIERIRKVWGDRIPGVDVRKRETSAVILPLVHKKDGWHILFEKRASSLVTQPGEICFPGGRVEEGETLRQAAVRETMEELLVREDQIEIIADLDPAMGPSGASIWPFAAILHDYKGTWSADEVDQVFTVALNWFLDHEPEKHWTELATVPGEDFPYELIPGGKNYPWRRKKNPMVFYRTRGGILWGVTGRMTYEFIQLLKEGQEKTEP